MNEQEKWVGSKSLALLRQGPFRRYIIGSLISDSGTWMQMMAQSWVMSGLTSKAILLGLVNFAAGLPALILAPVAGSLADRLDKRKILVATQIAQIIFAIALGFLVMSGHVRIWHIVFFALLLGIAFSYEMPAISALVPELVKRDEIAPAIALDRSVFHGSRLIGPSLAGFFVGWWGAAFLGSIGLLSVRRKSRLKFMSGNVLAIAAGVFLMSISQSFLLTACAMGAIAIALSMNFGLANTIVQEQAPAHLRGRVSAVFGMSFFGLMPVAGLITPGFADLIGMRTTLTIASVIYGIAAFSVLSLAGRHVCDRPVSPAPEPEIEPVC